MLLKEDFMKSFCCLICCCNVKDPALLKCGHLFCKDCIANWSSNSSKCPSGKKGFKKKDAQHEFPKYQEILSKVTFTNFGTSSNESISYWEFLNQTNREEESSFLFENKHYLSYNHFDLRDYVLQLCEKKVNEMSNGCSGLGRLRQTIKNEFQYFPFYFQMPSDLGQDLENKEAENQLDIVQKRLEKLGIKRFCFNLKEDAQRIIFLLIQISLALLKKDCFYFPSNIHIFSGKVFENNFGEHLQTILEKSKYEINKVAKLESNSESFMVIDQNPQIILKGDFSTRVLDKTIKSVNYDDISNTYYMGILQTGTGTNMTPKGLMFGTFVSFNPQNMIFLFGFDKTNYYGTINQQLNEEGEGIRINLNTTPVRVFSGFFKNGQKDVSGIELINYFEANKKLKEIKNERDKNINKILMTNPNIGSLWNDSGSSVLKEKSRSEVRNQMFSFTNVGAVKIKKPEDSNQKRSKSFKFLRQMENIDFKRIEYNFFDLKPRKKIKFDYLIPKLEQYGVVYKGDYEGDRKEGKGTLYAGSLFKMKGEFRKGLIKDGGWLIKQNNKSFEKIYKGGWRDGLPKTSVIEYQNFENMTLYLNALPGGRHFYVKDDEMLIFEGEVDEKMRCLDFVRSFELKTD